MLYWIWFVIFSVAGWFCGFKIKSNDQYIPATFFCMIVSIFMIWEIVILKLFVWLVFSLPDEPGIKEFTALVITAIPTLLWIALPFFPAFLPHSQAADNVAEIEVIEK